MKMYQKKPLISDSPPTDKQLQSRQQLRIDLAQEYQKAHQLQADGAKKRQKSQQLQADFPKNCEKFQQLRANCALARQKSQQLRASLNRGVLSEQLDCDSDFDVGQRFLAIEKLPLDSIEDFEALVQWQSEVDSCLEMVDQLELELAENLRSFEKSLEELPLNLGKLPPQAEPLIENGQLDALDRDISQESPGSPEWEKVVTAIDKFLSQYLSGDRSGNKEFTASDTL
ncbi:MAG: hypothetical protein AB1861_05585 [Cyanobacteriota bacterium]